MKSKILILYLIYLLNYEVISGQEGTLSCNYTTVSNIYTCSINIKNPRGLNNFVLINGTTASGKNDSDVRQITTTLGANSLNVPTIICGKFGAVNTIYLNGLDIQKLLIEN